MTIRKALPKKEEPKPFEAWNLLGVTDLGSELPPIPWVCEPLGLAPGAVSLVAGYGYSRKTMAMQSLLLSVAAKKSVWGLWSARPGKVVHLDYEQGRRLTQERYQRLARGMGFDIRDLPLGQLWVGCMPRVYIETHEAIDELAALCDGAAVVLVDSLRAAFPHANEDSSEVRTYLDQLSRLSERTGATIIVIHHARKPSAQNGGTTTHAIRGSSALFDACQSVYVFEGEKDTPTTVHHQKDRVRGVTLADFGLTSEDALGPAGEPRWGLRVVHLESEQIEEVSSRREDAHEERLVTQAAERIVKAIADCDFVFRGSARDAQSLVKGKTSVVKAAWNKLVSNGVLVRDGSYRDPVWRIVGGESGSRFPSGSHPVPGTASNPVPGSPPLKGGTGLHHSIDTPSEGDPVPRLLGEDERLFPPASPAPPAPPPTDDPWGGLLE